MRYYDSYGDPISFLFHAIVWIVVIWIIVAIIRGGRHSRRMEWWKEFHHKDPGMDVLRERYAKGEITKEEFDTKKKDLETR